ncbi:uncharacterized protein LOC101863945 [Aplysia californica]|uniref:Uncharacterized protein LOC101863945 n=1 Tax=Aplysia californica TaxID=6500 RepID=A0ABM0JBK8_APLCA|nr:uncharacterized protein LOC101863945 [Aplysia californica]
MTPPSPVLLVCTCLCVFLAVGQGQGNREHSSKVGVVVVVTDGVNTIDGRCHDDDNKLSEKGGNETSSTRDDPNRMMTSHFSSWIRGIVEVLDTSLAPDYEAVLVEGPCTEPGTTMHSFMSVVTAHRVTGVLSVTSSDTSKALRDVTSYLQLPLVEMVHGDLLVTPSVGPLHYVVPHFHYTLAQNVLFISHLFNWTAVSVTSPGQPRSANGVMDVFQRLASENGLCVLPAYLSEDVPRIVFGHLHANTTPSQLSSTSNLFVEHVDVDVLESFERNSSTGADMLYLQSMQYQWRQLAMMINSSCAQNSDVRNTTSSQNSSSSVDVFETFQLCSLEDSFQSFSSDTRAQIVHLVASISLLLSKSNIDLKTSSFCTHTQSSSSVMCLMFDPRLYRLDLNTNTVELVEELYRIRDVSGLDLSQRSKSVQMRGHTLLLPINLTDYVGRESCGNLCRYCARCLPSKMSDMTIMTSGEGELYVLGLFPIHKISPDGQCNLANPIGYAESVVFVDEFKKQQALLPSVGRRNIAAVVFDTCGSTAHAYTVINQVDSCDFTFQESQERRPIFIQPDSVVGIIESENDFGDTFVSNSKFRLVLDESGFSTSADLPITFIDNVLATLAHLQWTVINVIVSEDSEMLKLSEYLKTANSARTFCFVIHLVLPSSEDGLQVINRAFAGVTKTSVFLLLTTPRDTQELLHHLRVHADAKAVRLQYIFTPWNEKLHEYPDVEESSDTNIVFRSSSLSSSSPVVNVSLIKTSVNPWSSEFANSSTGLETLLEDGDHSEKFDVVQAMVQQLLPQLNSFNHPDKDFSSLVLTSTKLDVVAFYANGRTKAELGHVDGSVFTPTAKFFGRPHNTCSGWCPACNVCKAPAPPPPTSDHAHLHLSGDVIITGLFPLHSPGTEPFMCGQLQTDASVLLDVAAFIFALDTAKSRYPAFCPELKLVGWCSTHAQTLSPPLELSGTFTHVL